jgi:hypothetical protein
MVSSVARGPQARELAGFECFALLASVTTGRIAFDDDEGPVLLPAGHVVDNGTILLRVAGRFTPDRQRERVAYAVDDLGARTRATWSVLVRGTVRLLDPDRLPALPALPLAPPEPGPGDAPWVHLRLTPRTIVGRRLVAPGRC